MSFSLSGWLWYFSEPEFMPSLSSKIESIGLCLSDEYHAVACECCGYKAEVFETLGVPSQHHIVPMPHGEYVAIDLYGDRIALRYDNPLCAGESVLIAKGTGCDCQCSRP